MGGFSTKNLPLRQFCGDWADGKGTMMVISPDGSIIYLKNTANSSKSVIGSAEYDAYGFVLSGCCQSHLEGNYYNYNGRQPVFVVNGDALKKQKTGSLATIMTLARASISANAAINVGAIGAVGL